MWIVIAASFLIIFYNSQQYLTKLIQVVFSFFVLKFKICSKNFKNAKLMTKNDFFSPKNKYKK